MREDELIAKYKKLSMERVRDRLAGLRNSVVACQKEADTKRCARMLRAVGKDLRDISDLIFEATGEEEED